MSLIDLDEFLRQNCIDRIEGKSCEECKHHVLEVSCERLMEQPTIDPKRGKRMSDLISREAAIEALKRAEALTRAFGYHNVIKTIRELPTIDPVKEALEKLMDEDTNGLALIDDRSGKRADYFRVKHGRWVKLDLWTKPVCSVCGEPCFGLHGFSYETTDYCPNCGARMEGEEDERNPNQSE